MKETIVKLSTGEEVKVRPLTMREAKKCNFLSIMKKLTPKKPISEKDEEKDVEKKVSFRDVDIDENDIINIDKIFYPKAEDLTFNDAFKLFNVVLEESMKANF